MEGGLGIRDFKVFNMTMVAKQAWQIMTRSETLVAKIFKARRNIGDGSNIKVMDNPWLRGKGRGWVSAPQPKVCIIFDICSKQTKEVAGTRESGNGHLAIMEQ
ncbi:hypothetical protein L195_g008668 [Trifolium pratense]|uniref:Uncharacterized protein n=1 Tax=Trifolium pratense TaxID=57577 RepID=A0A2K3P9U6_TRIPR|nr:hypothetical protein L195_g008668 [Trifolium pratense]